MTSSICKLYAEIEAKSGTYRHHIADIQFEAQGMELVASLNADLSFTQEKACVLKRLIIDFHGLMLPVNLAGAPFDFHDGDSQRISHVALTLQ